ncbi:MAG: type IV pilus modification protein PilV [Pseudomonadota bacterium]|nr:type IV pilus modification protein PilV [Pseudomonadota bacterium]
MTEIPDRRASAGFSMIEVLITLVILMFGLLGISGLQARAQQAEFESYQRAQALVLLNDMADRINRNRETTPCYDITTSSGTPYLGSSATATAACSGYGSAATQRLAINDLTEWNNLLTGTAEVSGGNNIGAMTGARGCVTRDPATNSYAIAVAWQGIAETSAPAALAGATTATSNAISCGANLYGSETRRRVVWTTLRIAKLK